MSTNLKPTVAVLMGGTSLEAEVSRRSAREVKSALELRGFKTILIELDEEAPSILIRHKPDVVFPALHGPPGEDGTVQGFLDIIGIPYVGGGTRSSAIAMDKHLAKMMFRLSSLPVLDDILVSSNENPIETSQRILDHFPNGSVIKPLNQGSAIGVRRILETNATETIITEAFNEHSKETLFMVEPYVKGKEITVGVLDLHEHDTKALPVIEIETADNEWYDYHNRYASGKSTHHIPPNLPKTVQNRVQAIAVDAHTTIGLRDLSRADYLVTDENEIFLLEINSLPGMTPTSLYPEAANAYGIPFPELAEKLVLSAYHRNH